MAGTQQYNFPPPPPPPGPPPSNHPPQYGYAQPQQQYQQPPRGGGAPRGGRGGMHGGRGDFHAPYNPQQPNGGYIPPQNQGPLQNQAPQNGYGDPNAGSYIGPQAPGPQNHGPPNQQGPYGGPVPQWQPPQHAQQHAPPHLPHQHPQQPQMQHQQPPQAAPLSAQNYHPNYAPQAYQSQQQPQYGPQQPPQQFQPPQPSPYGHSVPPHQPPQGGPPQQWQGPPQQARPSFNNNRGRGGFSNGRGGHEAPLMGPPIRMGFDNDRGGGHVAQAGNGFPHQFANHQPAPVPFQPPYQSYPPPQEFGQRPPLDPNPFNSGPHRGRGGGNSNFRGRDRGNFQQFSRGGSNGGRDNNNRHQNNSHRSASNDFHNKSAGADANGNGKKKKKRRTTNTLGLTPNGVDHEDSEDEVDDVDEEARLVTLLGPDTPQLPTDLDAWLQERRSRFPTKARRDAAAEELRQRREQLRLSKLAKQNGDKVVIKKEEGESKLERTQRKAEKLRLELEKMERKIEQETLGSKRKRDNGDEGDEDNLAQSDEDSDDSSNSDSEGSKPETFSSRSNGPMRVMQPAKAQLQRHCKYYSTGGTCGKKGKCRFVHDQEVRNQALRDKEANGGKMTLAQRLILNDTAKDDLTILKSIKYLKEKGLMSEQLTGAPAMSDDGRYKSEENTYHENLNYGDN